MIPTKNIVFWIRSTEAGTHELWGRWNGLKAVRAIGSPGEPDYKANRKYAETSIAEQFTFQDDAGDV